MYSKASRINITEENFVSQVWYKYTSYWPIFLIMLTLCLSSAWLYLHIVTPVYESRAIILIKDKQKGTDDSKMMESLNQLSVTKIIENEMEIIRSRSLMIEVVKSLRLYAPVFEKKGFRSVSAYASSPIQIELAHPETLTEIKEVYFQFNKAASEVTINNQVYPLNSWTKTKYGTIRFTAGNTTAPVNSPLYFSLVDPKKIAYKLLKELDVAPAGKLSSVVSIKIKDEVPKRSEDIINKLIFVYNQADINDKNALAANTLLFIGERLTTAAHDLDSIERKLQTYKSAQGAVDIGSQGKLFLENISLNDRKQGDVNMQLAVLKKVEQYLLAKGNSGGVVPSLLGVADPVLSELLQTLHKAELDREKLKKTTGLNSSLILSLTDQIEKIKPSILENIQNQRKNLEAGKNNLNSTSSTYASMLQGIPKKERELVEITREQNIKSDIYTFLLQKKEETALAYSSTLADSRIVDAAGSSIKPVSPNTILVYLLSVCLSVGLGVIIISGKETFNRSITSRQEIELLTSVPVIGEIPFEKSNNNIVIGEGKTSFAAEQFRKLRTSHYFFGVNHKMKRLLVTSTLPNEGKSFITMNLGLSLALTGKKIILLAFDLKNPTLNKNVQTPGYGITEYLNGSAEPEEIIKRSTLNENLFIIQAGALTDNASDLITSSKVKDLLDYLDNIFDYIIIDTAPVGILSDAYVLSNYCDAILYVVRHNYTPKVLVANIDENNKNNQLKKMSIVFNGVKSSMLGSDNYGYKYANKYLKKEKAYKRKAGMYKQPLA